MVEETCEDVEELTGEVSEEGKEEGSEAHEELFEEMIEVFAVDEVDQDEVLLRPKSTCKHSFPIPSALLN